MTDKFYVGDTPLIKVDCVSNITGATGTKIYYKKPDGTSAFWDANIVNDPDTGLGRYLTYQVTNSGLIELDQKGDWKFQSYMSVGNWTGLGETAIQTIYEAFK